MIMIDFLRVKIIEVIDPEQTGPLKAETNSYIYQIVTIQPNTESWPQLWSVSFLVGFIDFSNFQAKKLEETNDAS